MADEAKVEEKDNFDVGPLSGPQGDYKIYKCIGCEYTGHWS